METVITLNPFESDPAYVEALNKSIKQAEAGDGIISISMEDFVAYTPKNKE